MLTAFLISVGIMCALTTGLALIMVIADATIGNYGQFTLTVNERKTLTVEGGRPLLATLKEQGIFIPSACGGRGSCGLCKVRILEGAGSLAPTELPWLTEDDRKNGTRLSCQVKVKKNLRLAIPEELFSVRQYATRVLALRDLTYDIKEVVLQLLDPPQMDLVAGQYVQFEVPAYELTDEPVYRAYSVASPPSQKDRVELEIRLVPRGICTTYVFTHLKVGDAVTINGPYGEFHLRDTPREIVCVAGGSGMAPIKAILHEMREKHNARKTTYFFGAKAKRDLFLVDEMRQLEKDLPNFTFVPALSAPDAGDAWDGEKGLITEVLERRMGPLTNHEAYLCGSPLMIDACIKVLKAKGLPDELIYFDKFA